MCKTADYRNSVHEEQVILASPHIQFKTVIFIGHT